MNMGGSITRQDQVEISIEGLSESLEAAKFKNPNDNDKVCEEQVEKTEPKGECRYCHEEEFVSKLEAPCSCDGSLKYAHRKCVSHWINVKRNIICEICKQSDVTTSTDTTWRKSPSPFNEYRLHIEKSFCRRHFWNTTPCGN
ncbi:hypothetical protein TSUD_169890 [Trifolium subterraneum]|nr:hypothetical protein TSUD_169890 [Trifolium subterraneum]